MKNSHDRDLSAKDNTGHISSARTSTDGDDLGQNTESAETDSKKVVTPDLSNGGNTTKLEHLSDASGNKTKSPTINATQRSYTGNGVEPHG